MKSLKDYSTPIFWAEGDPGKLDRALWKITFDGLIEKPQTLSFERLLKLPVSNVKARLTSVTRWSVEGIWTGISIKELASFLFCKKEAKYIRVFSYREIYDTSIPIEIALKEKTLLAFKFNEHDLTEDYGGPVRLFCPYLWGYKSAKSVVRVQFTDKYISGYWESRGYPDHATIEKGMVRDLNDNGKLKSIPGGEVIDFLS